MSSRFPISVVVAKCAIALLLTCSLAGIAVSIDVHSAAAGSTGALIVQKAASQAGIPYCNGGGGDNGPTVGDSSSQCAPGVVGYDCMSLAQYAVYQATGFAIEANGDNLPGGTDYTGVGTLVPQQSTVAEDEAGLQPGDVVLFGGHDPASYAHDGIWAGGDLIWDASGTPGQVQEDSFENLMNIYNNAYQGAVRYTDSVSPLTIIISSLPPATPGTAYGRVTLHAANLGVSTSPYVTTLKWHKVTLPKGLKLSSAGVLSGTPNKKLIPRTSSVTVQTTETVTTLNGKEKVKTKTTVQATIPLTID